MANKPTRKAASVRGLIKEHFMACGGAGTALTLRAIYDGIGRRIPAEEGVMSYGRVKGRSADDDTPVREKVAEGRKRLIYRALSDMVYQGEAAALGGRGWDKEYRLEKSFSPPKAVKRVRPKEKKGSRKPPKAE